MGEHNAFKRLILCYCKILEGIFEKIRRKTVERANKAGVQLNIVKEVMPNHPEINMFYKEYVGKSVRGFYEQIVLPEYRNAIAHFARHGEDPLVLSDYQTSADYKNLLLGLELSCRVVINSETSYLVEVAAKEALSRA